MTHLDGEGSTTKDASKKRVRDWIDKPDHKPKPGQPEPKEDALNDPAKNTPLGRGDEVVIHGFIDPVPEGDTVLGADADDGSPDKGEETENG